MHGSNRLGGNSLSDLLVFGRRAGLGAADYVAGLGDVRPSVSERQLAAAEAEALAPFENEGGENPYTVHQDLQQMMNDLVGIIRRADEVRERARGPRGPQGARRTRDRDRRAGRSTRAGTSRST